tara:strand:- start:482 stop:634 length:153 start_codon:yes stop_codon:yes gene_type:complete
MGREYLKGQVFSYPFSRKTRKLLKEKKIKHVTRNRIELKITTTPEKTTIR